MRRHAMGLAFFLVSATAITGFAQTAGTAAAPATPAGAAPAAGSTAAGAGTGAAAKPAGTGTAGSATAAPAAGAAGAAGTGTGAAGAAGTGTGTTTAGGPAVPIPEKPAMDGATYAVRLRDLEARVDELKDQIRRSHTRLALLSDTILSGGAAGSRSEIIFHNEMSSAFRLTKALVVIDGAVQYNRADDTGALADQKEIPIFNGSIQPGDHTVQVVLNFQGNGFGVFTYLRGYKFEVKSAHSFTAVEGKTISLTATALEKGGVTTPLEQRPTIEWQEKVNALGSGGAAAPTGGAVKASGGAAPGSASGNISIGGGK